jgi:trehalose synthase
MVAGRVGGIVDQVQDDETGFLVDSVVECAEALHSILERPHDARAMALRGKEHVRRHFLSPRLLRDWLALFNRLAGNDLAGAELVVGGAA